MSPDNNGAVSSRRRHFFGCCRIQWPILASSSSAGSDEAYRSVTVGTGGGQRIYYNMGAGLVVVISVNESALNPLPLF